MKIYRKYFSMHLKSAMQYKTSFFAAFFGQFFASLTSIFAIYFMFNRFKSVEGFTIIECFMCFSVINLGFSLTEAFARGFDIFPWIIGDGRFDRALVRPRNLVFQIISIEMDFTRLGKLVQALIVLIIAIPLSDITWTASKVLTLLFMILCSAIVYFGIFIVYATVSFFTIEGIEFMNIFTYGSKEFGQYPYSIYGKGVLTFLTFVFPLALVQYYPFLYLSGRVDNISYMFLPLLSLLFLIPCIFFWRFGVSRYKSIGS